MSAEQVRAVANYVWDEVNAVNLREHILPTRERADIVVTKRADHSIESVRT
jgi:type I pantothenate kinase